MDLGADRSRSRGGAGAGSRRAQGRRIPRSSWHPNGDRRQSTEDGATIGTASSWSRGRGRGRGGRGRFAGGFSQRSRPYGRSDGASRSLSAADPEGEAVYSGSKSQVWVR